MPDLRVIVGYLWAGVGIVWVAGAFTTKSTARAQPVSSRLLEIALGVGAFAVGFTKYLKLGLLARPFVPASPVTAAVGLILVLAGLGLAVWARLVLGRNWSGWVTIKENHTLVRQGPYAIVRHPIYSGLLLAVLGTAIASRELRVLVATGLVLLLVCMKLRVEETFMKEEFGAEYTEYQRQVKTLIPLVW